MPVWPAGPVALRHIRDEIHLPPDPDGDSGGAVLILQKRIDPAGKEAYRQHLRRELIEDLSDGAHVSALIEQLNQYTRLAIEGRLLYVDVLVEETRAALFAKYPASPPPARRWWR